MQKRVNFRSKKGFNLSGVLHTPDVKETLGYAILAHCFTCTKSLDAGNYIANILAAEGIASLRFDFTGLGASKGQFSETSFTSNLDDLDSAALFLKTHYNSPQVLIGHSLGGTAALAAAARIASVKAVATIGAPASPEHILHLLRDQLENIQEHGSASVTLGGHTHKFQQCFVDDVKNCTLDISKLGKALMVMHAPFDDTVSIDEATKIFVAARHPKSFVTLDKSDHLLSNPDDSKFVGGLIANWAKRYIEPTRQILSKELEKRVVVAAETSKGFYNVISTGEHTDIRKKLQRKMRNWFQRQGDSVYAEKH